MADRLLEAQLTTTGSPVSYRYLARQIDNDIPASAGGKVVLLSRAAPPAACNESFLLLASTMRRELGCTVLLIDGTFGDGGISASLGLREAPGLADMARGEGLTFADVVVETRLRGVFIVSAGAPDAPEPAAMDSQTLLALLAEARRSFDFVLVQQGEIFEQSAYLGLASAADLILIVTQE
ncbi:MAG: hypothetical protein JOZ27_06795, partial [Caulobacteraceae bacterium]|nr:hypothetical protein [Caulobacteraceae bacterium]